VRHPPHCDINERPNQISRKGEAKGKGNSPLKALRASNSERVGQKLRKGESEPSLQVRGKDGEKEGGGRGQETRKNITKKFLFQSGTQGTEV